MTILDRSLVLLDLSCEHSQGTVLARNILGREWKQPNVSGNGEDFASHHPYSVWACSDTMTALPVGCKGQILRVFESVEESSFGGGGGNFATSTIEPAN